MKKIALFLLACLYVGSGCAASIAVSQPWVKGTLPSARSSAAFMEILSPENGRIIAASSPLAQSVTMQEMRFAFDGGPLRPTPVSELVLQARRKLQLSPVTAHFVLHGLARPIQAGDRIPLLLTIRLDNGETQELRVEAIGRGLAP